MAKVLYIKANPKIKGSRSLEISDAFINEYKKSNPNDEVVTLDLYREKIDFINQEDLEYLFLPKNDESKNNKVLKFAYQFQEADKYIFSAPMWNLSFPAILKAYIDYVTVSGITFKYTDKGPVGLCSGKKALFVTTRGGIFSTGPAKDFEMGEKYMEAILGFLGIHGLETIVAEGLDMQDTNVRELIDKSIDESKKLAEKF
ncbi:MAG: FMN-dependent NADH-azoreductase [Clostridium sp.]